MTEDARRRLNDAWSTPRTVLGWLGAVNHKQIGLRYIATALGFFLLAGVDITLIRAQLAVPDAGILPPDRFNQLFTTHGTAMMFLFAIPIVEGIAIYLLPLMLGAREMAFPRLNAFGYWLYLFGGLLLYASTLPDIVNFVWPGGQLLPVVVPDAGWFAYPPLSSGTYSPGLGLDFWLMGVTLAELSAMVAAIEIGATILTIRAAGMTPMRLPLFAWSVLVMAFAIIFAFPAVVLASTLLELERAFGMPFYDPVLGGSPILWQHLFWIFGHPEVYIMFLPATGIVSMILPAFAGRPIIGYRLIVAALIATAVLSFGLWVHHMFAAGLPWLGLAYFSAASMLITIPSGIQVFAWLATLVKAPRLRLTTPMLFVLGFLVTFVLGGVTGVMVASVPFDLQAHDTYFVVAHFHYVLVGGVVFPVFAALFYWFPKATGRFLSERLGRWFFWLFFIGFNVTFLPQHQLGLLGMRRRVYTYESEPWMNLLNLVSSLGQGLMIVAVVVLGVALVLAYRARPTAPADPWRGRTLEWAVASPPPQHNFTTLPVVTDPEPLADDPELSSRLDPPPARPPHRGSRYSAAARDDDGPSARRGAGRPGPHAPEQPHATRGSRIRRRHLHRVPAPPLPAGPPQRRRRGRGAPGVGLARRGRVRPACARHDARCRGHGRPAGARAPHLGRVAGHRAGGDLLARRRIRPSLPGVRLGRVAAGGRSAAGRHPDRRRRRPSGGGRGQRRPGVASSTSGQAIRARTSARVDDRGDGPIHRNDGVGGARRDPGSGRLRACRGALGAHRAHDRDRT